MLALEAIEVYLASATEKASWEAIEYRLKHVVAYIATLPSPNTLCQEVDEAWIAKFRAWSEGVPVANSKDGRQRALSTIENSVIQLAAAFRFSAIIEDIANEIEAGCQGAFSPQNTAPGDADYSSRQSLSN